MKIGNLFSDMSLNKTLSVFLSFLFGLLLFVSNAKVISASTQSDLHNPDSVVIEYLRLTVSGKDRNAWLIAEKTSWEPWLKGQKGFIGRELLWDPEQEEAVLLIRWASRKDWKSIPQSEIDKVQELFEKTAKESTGKKLKNPFPIKSQGEFLPQ